MKEHTFSVGNKPRVVMSRVNGDVLVRPWKERTISVRMTGENEDGSVAQPYSEGETVYIHDCTGSLELFVPYEKKVFGSASITTDISITDLDGSVSMERVGNVDVTNSSGEVTLSHVEGSLRATNAPRVVEGKGIGGSATLENVSRVEIGVVGAALSVTRAEIVKIGSVGSSVRATQIGANFHCGSVGGGCEILDSADADISVSTVGGSLMLACVARIASCTVGGSLNARINIPHNESTNFVVGGSATLSLPRDADMRMRIMAGGSISGEAISQKRRYMAMLTYGNGSASLNLTVGGSVKLSWATAAADDATQREQPSNAVQKREAILKMVAQGRITPEEGNVLLEALGE